jgi:hypothetical protein
MEARLLSADGPFTCYGVVRHSTGTQLVWGAAASPSRPTTPLDHPFCRTTSTE